MLEFLSIARPDLVGAGPGQKRSETAAKRPNGAPKVSSKVSSSAAPWQWTPALADTSGRSASSARWILDSVGTGAALGWFSGALIAGRGGPNVGAAPEGGPIYLTRAVFAFPDQVDVELVPRHPEWGLREPERSRTISWQHRRRQLIDGLHQQARSSTA